LQDVCTPDENGKSKRWAAFQIINLNFIA